MTHPTDTLSPAEYAEFLRGHARSEFPQANVLLFGTPDDQTILSVYHIFFSDYCCGLLIRPDNGALVQATADMTSAQTHAYLQAHPSAQDVLLLFVDPLDAMNFLTRQVMGALALMAERNGVKSEKDGDELFERMGLEARQELLDLRRASRALLRAIRQGDAQAQAAAAERVTALVGEV